MNDVETQSDFPEWWTEEHAADELSNFNNRSLAEDAWRESDKRSTKHTWDQVFQVMGDYPNDIPREAVKQLEALRDRAGAGPDV